MEVGVKVRGNRVRARGEKGSMHRGRAENEWNDRRACMVLPIGIPET